MKFKVGDIVIYKGKWNGEIENTSLYRPPEERYAVALDEYTEDYIFCGEWDLELFVKVRNFDEED